MANKKLTRAGTNWRQKIKTYQEMLAELRPQLVEAEAEVAERLAAISAFEFKLRARIAHLTRKIDALEAEIHAYRQKLRWMGDNWDDIDSDGAWKMDDSAAEGDYRYRDNVAPKSPRQKLDEAEKAEIKQLYRQLARRFHPDMAVDEEDRAYRTQMMMAINAAYTTGDLDKLKELAEAPDAAHRTDYAKSDEQLAQTLLKELTHVQRRLEEIKEELARLERHRSTQLMQQQERAEAEERDWFAEVEEQLRHDIAHKMVERDVLKNQLENIESNRDLYDTAIDSEEFANMVWDATLDDSFEGDIAPENDRWIRRRRDRFDYDEDILDDYE